MVKYHLVSTDVIRGNKIIPLACAQAFYIWSPKMGRGWGYKWGRFGVFKIFNNEGGGGGLKKFNINRKVRHNGRVDLEMEGGMEGNPFPTNFSVTNT